MSKALHINVPAPIQPLLRAPLARQDTDFQQGLQLPDIEEEFVQPVRDETIEMVPLVPQMPPPALGSRVMIPSIQINDKPEEHRRTSDVEERVELKVAFERPPSQLRGIVGQVVPLIGQLLGGLPPLPPHERQNLHRYVSMPAHGNRRGSATERRVSERQEDPKRLEGTIEEEIIVPRDASQVNTSKLDRLTRLVVLLTLLKCTM